ncbi:enterobactin exporter EntS [Klebsiella quasipneumoniae]|uniref:enterobactin transporter EntS n=1 Tax=Klebsiella quasipneumoniae TaxID=1463165 RepID=UPI0009BC4A84|nr:enterobactin transporter EntS [Klebsiella quasipneumoniae]HBQ3757637.1 enterobactin transporter EntS [Klebsiella quasipneumoniae subsp. similipneumoniae]SLR30335.1 enterobactin exporter EntS [Klebsiella quasipneumoniae]VEB77143.1 enterobactin exporter EntS [Klebsiella quasipneumoniae]HBW8872917.1 enterobactin transporter EntS [Klebsiella quasipneumoniae subsp. similipneumoniae]HCI7045960.1 enterobactin transporter EntS [Klebsiella quasipneumoniae subsp. similipneumoniae]
MNRQSWLLNLSLLKTHPAFRAVFIARFISILSLGLLGVAIPVQIQIMTHSTWQVGLSVTLTGASMFIGLMVGGVLADRYERKRLILLARGTCGVGFVGLCLNALLPEPSLAAIYLLGIWDGFFASLGVTALLAATPALVGRENLMQAGAITMLTVRLGSVISPMIGGLLLASGGVAWNFGLAAAGTFITTLTLLRLPQLPPPPQPREHPLRALLAGLTFLCQSPLIGGIALLGGLLTMASAVRVLYPALAGSWQMSAGQIGLLYAAIPLGAALGALTSGQLAQTVRPGALMLATTVCSFVAIALFSLMPHWALGALCLALFGWLSAISSLLQYTLIQTQTPEHMLGRINGLWTAQNVTGDAIGAALLGGLGAVMTPVASASASGWALALVGVLLVGLLRELRRFQRPEIVKES